MQDVKDGDFTPECFPTGMNGTERILLFSKRNRRSGEGKT